MVYVGIDPGLTGALAVIDGGEVEVFDTPILKIKVGKSMKNHMDPAACSLMLAGISARFRDDVFVTIEKVAPMPSFKVQKKGEAPKEQPMGVTSAFNFGMGYGIWIGIVADSLLPYQLVHPATWKRNLMADMEKGKDADRVRALQLYPRMAESLSRVKDHGRADAILLAHWGKISYTQRPAVAVEKQEPQLEIF